MHPFRVIRAVRDAFPREATVAIDVGCIAQHMAGGSPFFRVYEPRSLIVPSSFYGMGFAAAGLPAARLVHPDRPAVGFVGDGSFQMVMNVLPTAAEHRLGVTWCVLNDGALGSIRDIQQYRFERAHPRDRVRVPARLRRDRPGVRLPRRARRGPRGRRGSARARPSRRTSAACPAVLDFVVARERMLGRRSSTTASTPRSSSSCASARSRRHARAMLGFGQPARRRLPVRLRGGGHRAVSIAELRRAARRRPWFVRGPFRPPDGRYRGGPMHALVQPRARLHRPRDGRARPAARRQPRRSSTRAAVRAATASTTGRW